MNSFSWTNEDGSVKNEIKTKKPNYFLGDNFKRNCENDNTVCICSPTINSIKKDFRIFILLYNIRYVIYFNI